MNNQIPIRLLGVVTIIWGVTIFFKPEQYTKHGIWLDFSEFPIIASLIVIIVGCLWVWTTYRKKE